LNFGHLILPGRAHAFHALAGFWRRIAVEADSNVRGQFMDVVNGDCRRLFGAGAFSGAGTAVSLRNSSNPDGENTRR
jgi:hypothetical protein